MYLVSMHTDTNNLGTNNVTTFEKKTKKRSYNIQNFISVLLY